MEFSFSHGSTSSSFPWSSTKGIVLLSHKIMANDVVDSMEKMKLTSEEEEIIAISDEGRLEALESCQLSLIGKFLMCKPFNKMAAKNKIRRAWGVNDTMQILEVGLNLFQFKFQSEFEMNQIFKGGPWSFDNQLLMLQ